ncbi:hypothetical protein GTA08_BOTSDO07499 [Neofusicoccum parvum]|uniref:Uncharacterized protein n=1 Tax=Neofusicoccum parvum TaxID=310453 RepID=A0ACB5SB28_9PEZI|nr:hypothetical protein GTA08_BOTSDO07499 [Neofusicoccum parvum]GME37285.1 hypothetical protein GTA08_BOTSDO07499 [Neofusicoccum parvum]
MRFTIPLALAFAAAASAAAVPEPNAMAGEVTVSDGVSVEVVDIDASAEVSLEKRGATAETVGGKAGDAGLAIGKIFNALLQKLVPLKDWTPAREAFTKETTALMWANNPNPSKWVAVACYNKGWRVKNYGAISDVQDVNLKLGALHTDYDCMYIGRNNQFYTDGEGGYINLCYRYNGNICSFDGKTGDLTCN